jgi:hypothetical protein
LVPVASSTDSGWAPQLGADTGVQRIAGSKQQRATHLDRQRGVGQGVGVQIVSGQQSHHGLTAASAVGVERPLRGADRGGDPIGTADPVG